MALTPVEFPRFAGLDLNNDAQELSATAIDALNADLSRLGRVRGRDGYAKFTSSAAAQRYINLCGFDPTDFNLPATFGPKCVYAARVSGSAVFVDQITTAGVATQIFTASPATMDNCYALFSTGDGVLFGGKNQQMQIFSGPTPTVTAIVSAYRAQYFAYQTPDARIVAAANLTVAFSNPRDATTWGVNNNVILPFESEYISGAVSWGNLVFVFKRSSFYVFYGNSTDGNGNPIFNFRGVRNGIGCAADRGSTVGTDGVYFIHNTGIYRATGPFPATEISGPVRNIFTGDLPPYFQGLALNQAQISKAVVQWINNKLFVSYPSGSATVNDKTLVFDNGQWSLWDLPIGAAGTLRVSSQYDLLFAYASGTNDIGRYATTPGYTDDAGTTINWRYRLPFWNPGKPGTEADLYELLLDGSGTVTVKTAVNDTTTLGTGAAVVLGTAPAITQGRDTRAVFGRNISVELSGTGQSTVSRVTANVASTTESGFKT